MTVVSRGRVVLFFLVWPFSSSLGWMFNFLLLCFSPRVAVHCCHCEWSVRCKQTFLCAFIFYENFILKRTDGLTWEVQTRTSCVDGTLSGVFFFSLFFCVLRGRRPGGDAVWPLRPPPPHPRLSWGVPGGGSSDKSTMRQIWIWVWNKRKERDTASTNC